MVEGVMGGCVDGVDLEPPVTKLPPNSLALGVAATDDVGWVFQFSSSILVEVAGGSHQPCCTAFKTAVVLCGRFRCCWWTSSPWR